MVLHCTEPFVFTICWKGCKGPNHPSLYLYFKAELFVNLQEARGMIKQSVKLWLPQLQDSDKPGTSSSQKECSVVGENIQLGVFSSPDPKAHRSAYSIGSHPSLVVGIHQHFQTTSPLKPLSQFLPYFSYSICRQVERIILFFLSKSDKNSSCYL